MTRLGLADQMTTIGLTELNEQAELQARVDRKYLVNTRVLDGLGDWLDTGARVLEINGSRSASYRSIYFDTPDLLSFHQAARGRRRRFKLRTRAYCDSEMAFLEAKTKGSRGFTSKERIPHDFAHLDRLDAEARDYAVGVLLSVGEERPRASDLAPVMETAYQRTTILVPAPIDEPLAASRVTVDTELRWELLAAAPAGRAETLYRPDLAIIETKSGVRPSPTDRALWRHGIRPESLSKYATGLAAMVPTLTTNRWARTLHRNF